MAGLMEQYEQSSQISGTPRPTSSPSGVLAATPIFSKQKVNFRPLSPISHLVVASNQLVIAMANKSLLRIDLLNPDNPQEVDLSRETAGSRLQHLFLDPSGQHLLVSTVPREGDLANAALLYIGGKTTKARLVAALRGQLVSAVGWSHTAVTAGRTGPLLAGNSQGVLTELELCSDEGMFSRLETYYKQVFDAGEQRAPAAITAVEYHRLPQSDRYMALVATPCRLYQFVETVNSHDARPLLAAVFATGVQASERFLEIPSTLSFSRLAFFYPKVGEPPSSFAWMTEPGILYGELDTSGSDTILGETRLMPPPGEESTTAGGGKAQPLRALALTQFHVLSVQAARLRASCVLDQRHVFEDLANQEHGPLVTICRDPVRGTLWSAAERAVYKYKVVDETRDVWQVFVQRGEYELARRHCRDNPHLVETILSHQAQHCFDRQEYAEAARLFADSQQRLEGVALKFVSKQEYEPLRQFLMSRLERLPAEKSLQAALLVLWSLELFLTHLGALRDADDPAGARLRQQMMAFLTSHQVLLLTRPARRAVYQLMWRHGQAAAVTELAERLQDWATVVQQQLTHGHLTGALETLRLHPSPELIYQHVPRLVATEPALTVDLLIGQGRQLRPAMLLPRLILANTSEQPGLQILRYLEFCVQSLESQCSVAHNYLVTLYVRHQPAKLMTYLRAQGLDRHCVHYTPGHVLRQCWRRHPQAAVHVLTVLERYQDAVQLALQHDVSLAKEVANRPEDDDSLKKRLWLEIAKHTIRHDQDVQRTMQFLSECRLLHIEDVLPFFPNFVTIESFKEAICDSLQSYNEHIEELRAEMKEATRANEVLREEIADFRSGFVTIEASDTCEVCKHQLLTRPLYAFPCGHQFHQDCLTSEVMTYLTEEERRTVAELQHQLETLPGEDLAVAAAASPRTLAREQLDLLVAAQCLYCGDYLIRCLDEPLLNDFPEEAPQR